MTVMHNDSSNNSFLGHDRLNRYEEKWSLQRIFAAIQSSLRTDDDADHNDNNRERAPRHGLLGKLYHYPPPELDSRRSETAWLDGLRGMAATIVMLSHYGEGILGAYQGAPYNAPELSLTPDSDPAWQLQRLPLIRFFFSSGHAQVSIFFVLSGIVLSWAPLKAIARQGRGTTYDDQPKSLEPFAQRLVSLAFRRWMRLFLPCFCIGLISMLGIWTGLTSLPLTVFDSIFVQIWDYIKACEEFANPFSLHRDEIHLSHKYNWVMWTIPLEWGGSLLIFLLLVALSRTQKYGARMLVVSIISLYSCYLTQWTFWLFSFGFLIADYAQQSGGFEAISATTSVSRAFWSSMLIVGLFLGGIPVQSPLYSRTGYEWIQDRTPFKYALIRQGDRFWWCLSAIFILLSASHLKFIRRIFEHNILRYLGRISFMLYLSHQITGEVLGTPILRFSKNVLGSMYFNEGMQATVLEVHGNFPNMIMFMFNVMLLVPLALFVANWLEIYVDTPCTKFARRVDRFMAS